MGYTKITKIGNTGSVKIDMTPLESLTSGINERFVVRIGILGSKATADHYRKEAGAKKKAGGHKIGQLASIATNAEIGLVHEKGSKSRKIPRRSWLETPLQDHLGIYFAKIGIKALAKLLESQPKAAYHELGIICEQIIQKGFESGGYGKWKALKASTIARKGSDAILIDTAQLRRSITHEVVAK